ncbi:MAG TPA: carboxypeptidase regulatory-like domain-containing protein [Candidatus Angelobacter sp.]
MRHCGFLLRRCGASALVLMLFAGAATLQSQAQASAVGEWTALQTWPTRAVHATLLPDGRVLFVSYYSESLQPHVWDPESNTFSPTTASQYALFCAGHTSMPDGRVFIAGGHIADFVGYAHTSIYDPSSNTLTPAADMNKGRWYPTVTVLANGDLLVVSGDVNSNTANNTLPQVYSPATNTWRDLTTAQLSLPLYPLMFVAPNGKVFNAGASPPTRYLDTSGTGAWTSVATTKFGASGAWRSYGPGVMYESGKVLLVGGGDPPTASTEMIDLNAATPAWSNSGSMHFARRQHNAVVLPDGKVLVVGGSSAGGFDTSTAPVAQAEMWDPATGQFTVMASIAVYRGYHSTALLLPDGRVLSAGGNVGGPNAQIYSPPYLFAGARPVISSAPTSADYGQSVFIGTADAASITRVSFIHIGSVTHTFDQSARSMRLSFTQGTGGLNVTMPANGNLAPPGYYMLFIVNGGGVPSVANIMKISSGGGSSGVLTGKVTNNAGAALLGATVTAGSSTAQTAADGSWQLSNVAAGSVTVSAALTGYSSASESATITAGNTTTAATLALAPVNPGNVTGQVVNSAGTGILGVTVFADGLTVSSDAGGNYALANLPAGAAAITASATGFANGSATVTVVAAITTVAPVITLISSSGGITGTVKSSSGAAIAGASVGFGGGGAKTSSTGAYTISGVPAGTVQLVASATGFQSVTQNVTVTGGATSTANFTLTPVTTGTGTVTGKVTNVSTGGALSGATVKWSGGSTTTSTTGIYTLTGVTAGSVSVTASHTGYLARTLTLTVSGGATSTLNIPLATAGKISVTATAPGGAVVSGATVTIKGGVLATTVTGTTSSTGVFTTVFIPIGSYTVSVAKTGHTTQTKPATVTSGVTTSLSFTNF